MIISKQKAIASYSNLEISWGEFSLALSWCEFIIIISNNPYFNVFNKIRKIFFYISVTLYLDIDN